MPSFLRIAVIGMLLIGAGSLSAQEHSSRREDPSSLSRFEFLQIRMAVPVRITVYAPEEAIANRAVRKAYARFKELDRLMSDYDPDSELSVLCREAVPGEPRHVSVELLSVLQRAHQISRQTDGAFDVTVGPLTQLWRTSRRNQRIPADDVREQALSRVGWQNLVVDPRHQSVALRVPEMQLDLGGIAKGYAADQALATLSREGVSMALVDAGGDVVAGDPPPGQSGWRIGVAPLDQPRGTPDRFLRLANRAIATSGDASQHVEIDGVRYSHIVDPQTGLGVTTPSSVTVIAPDGITADSLASAVSVLGPVRGIELIERLDDAEAYVVVRDAAGDPVFHATSGLDELLIGPDR